MMRKLGTCYFSPWFRLLLAALGCGELALFLLVSPGQANALPWGDSIWILAVLSLYFFFLVTRPQGFRLYRQFFTTSGLGAVDYTAGLLLSCMLAHVWVNSDIQHFSHFMLQLPYHFKGGQDVPVGLNCSMCCSGYWQSNWEGKILAVGSRAGVHWFRTFLVSFRHVPCLGSVWKSVTETNRVLQNFWHKTEYK